MFSGIIEKKAKIISITDGRFVVENIFLGELNIGQSIAHDGACMTVEKFDDQSYTFFAMQESFSRTNFGNKKLGDYFNVERCIKVGDRLDGHFVTGHIDTVGTITKYEKQTDDSLILGVEFPQEFSKLIVEKGSVSLNGVSLTVVNPQTPLSGDLNIELTVSLIPLTLEVTNLGDLQIGDSVNLEFDILGKYILKK